MLQKASRFLLAAMVVLAMSTALASASASGDRGQGDTIRIAIPVSSDETDRDTHQGYIGYTMEYLHEIAQYTGWQYEVLEVSDSYDDGLETALDMVRRGEADLVAPVQYEDCTTEGIYFSQNIYATAMTILQVPNAVYQGVELSGTLRVATLAGSGMQAAADDFFERIGVQPIYVPCSTVNEQIQTVCSGEADVMLNSNLEYIPDMSLVAEFSPQALYFAAGDRQLLQELDDAMVYIKQANPSYSRELYMSYFDAGSQALTLEETEFIKQSDPYVVAVLDHNEPYQYLDSETGEFCGIAVDLLHHVSQETGLQFTFVTVNSWDELLQKMESNEVQMVAAMPYDYSFASQRNLTISRSFTSSPYMLLARPGFSGPVEGQQLALTEVSTYTEGNYVGDVTRYSNMGQCIEAVHTGNADYTYVDLYTAQYYLNDPRYRALNLTPQSYTPRTLCFGLAKPTSHQLISILNKSIYQLSAANLQAIINQNVNPPREMTITDIIVDYPMESIAIIGTLSLLVAGLLLFFLWEKERVSRVLRKKAMEDSLTHLYNASAYRKLVIKQLRRMEADQLGAFLIFDLDNFKNVNDDYGHQAGDQILRQFAILLQDVMGNDSILARVGGDEFAAFFPSMEGVESIEAVCSQICQKTHSIVVGAKEISVSVGAAPAHASDDYDALYRLADGALYEAKGNKKDQYCLAQRDAAEVS